MFPQEVLIRKAKDSPNSYSNNLQVSCYGIDSMQLQISVDGADHEFDHPTNFTSHQTINLEPSNGSVSSGDLQTCSFSNLPGNVKWYKLVIQSGFVPFPTIHSVVIE